MRVCVLGAGAIGMIYAARLARAIHPEAEAVGPRQMVLVTRRDGARQELRGGLTVDGPDGQATTHVGACAPDELADHSQDLVLLATKTYDLDETLPLVARMLAPQGACLSLQNGVDVVPRLDRALGRHRAFQGATSFAVTAIGMARVRLAGPGMTWIPDTLPHLEEFDPWLVDAQLHPVRVSDMDAIIWTKAAGVAANVCGVLLETPAGRLVQDRRMRLLYEAALSEIVLVANAIGMRLEVKAVQTSLRGMWDKLSPSARGSMLDDFLAGRPLELESRLGAIVRLGEANGVPIPTLEALYTLAVEKVRLRDQGYRCSGATSLAV